MSPKLKDERYFSRHLISRRLRVLLLLPMIGIFQANRDALGDEVNATIQSIQAFSERTNAMDYVVEQRTRYPAGEVAKDVAQDDAPQTEQDGFTGNGSFVPIESQDLLVRVEASHRDGAVRLALLEVKLEQLLTDNRRTGNHYGRDVPGTGYTVTVDDPTRGEEAVYGPAVDGVKIEGGLIYDQIDWSYLTKSLYFTAFHPLALAKFGSDERLTADFWARCTIVEIEEERVFVEYEDEQFLHRWEFQIHEQVGLNGYEVITKFFEGSPLTAYRLKVLETQQRGHFALPKTVETFTYTFDPAVPASYADYRTLTKYAIDDAELPLPGDAASVWIEWPTGTRVQERRIGRVIEIGAEASVLTDEKIADHLRASLAAEAEARDAAERMLETIERNP